MTYETIMWILTTTVLSTRHWRTFYMNFLTTSMIMSDSESAFLKKKVA